MEAQGLVCFFLIISFLVLLIPTGNLECLHLSFLHHSLEESKRIFFAPPLTLLHRVNRIVCAIGQSQGSVKNVKAICTTLGNRNLF